MDFLFVQFHSTIKLYFILANSVIKALIISFSFIESGVLDECKSCVINI